MILPSKLNVFRRIWKKEVLLLTVVMIVLFAPGTQNIVRGFTLPTLPSMDGMHLHSITANRILSYNSFLMGKRIKRKTVIVTAASYDVIDLVKNLNCFVQQSSKTNLVVFSFDPEMTKTCIKLGIPTIPWWIERKGTDNWSFNKTKPPAFGTKQFSHVALAKLDVVRSVLLLGYDTIFTDTDIIWCKDVPRRLLDYIEKYPSYDIFIQSNGKSRFVLKDVNTGFYYVKSSESTITLYSKLSGLIEHWLRKSAYGDDQSLFWSYVCSKGKNMSGNGVIDVNAGNGNTAPQFVCQWKNSTVQAFLLPITEFPNGASDPEGRSLSEIPKGYYRSICRERGISIWHINYCKGRTKFQRMREQNVWLSTDDGHCEMI